MNMDSVTSVSYTHLAALVALCGSRLLARSPTLSYHELLPQYLRRPEAERRLAERGRDVYKRQGQRTAVSLDPVDAPHLHIGKQPGQPDISIQHRCV